MHKRQALIVDDSLSMRSIIAVTLHKLGFEPVVAKDGAQAFEFSKDKQYKFDIIITDMNMPNVNGVELIGMLRGTEAYKYVPILVVSTEGGTPIKESGRKAGASGWIVKPFQPEALADAVTKLCGHSSSHHSGNK